MQSNGTLLNLSSSQLRKAADLQDKIESLQEELAALLNGEGEPLAPKKQGRRKMSAESKERMAAAQRARWKKSRGEESPTATPAGKKKGKRTMSAEAKQRISAAAKARWAKVKAASPAK